MHKRVIQYVNKFNILYKQQFGFQKSKPTEHAILDYHRKIIKLIEKHEKPALHSWILRRLLIQKIMIYY